MHSLEVGFYLLEASPDKLVMVRGVPDKTYKQDGLEVYEYIEGVESSSYSYAIPNYSHNYLNGTNQLESINSYGSGTSFAKTTRYIIKNNKIIAFIMPSGRGQVNDEMTKVLNSNSQK